MIPLSGPTGHLLKDIFSSASSGEYDINRLFLQFLVMAGVIMFVVIVMVVAGGYLYYFRRRKSIPAQHSGNRWLEITWTLVPFAVLMVFFFLTLKTMREIDRPVPPGRSPDILIIAHQWWWDMRYPLLGVITANELHVPVGQRLLVCVQSADVIHDWWVPALGRKIDAVPGKPNYTWIQVDHPGLYLGTCSEYCGEEHAWMRIRVIAQDDGEFLTWIGQQQQGALIPTSLLAQKGALVFSNKTCSGCHAIKGTSAMARIAPDLTHVASRQTILSGMLENTPLNLRRWLKNPQEVKPGARMPDFMLDNTELSSLIAYLETLK